MAIGWWGRILIDISRIPDQDRTGLTGRRNETHLSQALTVDILLPVDIKARERRGGCALAEDVEAHDTKIIKRVELNCH